MSSTEVRSSTSGRVMTVEQRGLEYYKNELIKAQQKLDNAKKRLERRQRDFNIAFSPFTRKHSAKWVARHEGTTENAVWAVRKRIGIKGWQK